MSTPFDYEKFKAGAPAITRDGIPVTFAQVVPNITRTDSMVVTLEGYEGPFWYLPSGKYLNEKIDSENDLFLIPRTRIMWFGRSRQRLSAGDYVSDLLTHGYNSEQELREALGSSFDKIWEVLSIEVQE